jgi:DNA-directed RNA polymerase omega subunit
MKQFIIEECLNKISNGFELVRLVSMRAKQLTKGRKQLVENKGEKGILASMREVAEGKVFFLNEKNEKNE